MGGSDQGHTRSTTATAFWADFSPSHSTQLCECDEENPASSKSCCRCGADASLLGLTPHWYTIVDPPCKEVCLCLHVSSMPQGSRTLVQATPYAQRPGMHSYMHSDLCAQRPLLTCVHGDPCTVPPLLVHACTATGALVCTQYVHSNPSSDRVAIA